MTLLEKIITIYPELKDYNWVHPNTKIFLQNDSDGRGDYIAKWEHPTLSRPTQAQLDAVKE